MRQSIAAAGLDPSNLVSHAKLDLGTEAKVWREIWSAGQGVGSIDDIPTASELCARLRREFDKARSGV
jgi:nitronate monooxygenase